MVASIAESTIRQYNTALKNWWSFCQIQRINPFYAEDTVVLGCLTRKFQEGAAYGTLNTLRSAIALINNCDITESAVIHRFLKGVFRLRPSVPKYSTTWDVGIVLDKLESWGPTTSLDLRQLSLKLVMLLAIGSAFRVQTLSLIKLESIKVLNNGLEIKIKDLIKTSRPGADQPYVFFPIFENKELCITTTLLQYIEITKSIRGNVKQLIISFKNPHREVGTQSISR